MRKHSCYKGKADVRNGGHTYFNPAEAEPGKPALQSWEESPIPGKHAPALPVQIEGRDDSDTAEDEKLDRDADDFERG